MSLDDNGWSSSAEKDELNKWKCTSVFSESSKRLDVI
jgi:hypothetical protein